MNAQQTNKQFKLGFTLAETLITLTILGVLAAITIPTMMSDVTSRANQQAHTIFSGTGALLGIDKSLSGQGTLPEALRQMNLNDDLMGHNNTAEFVTALDDYLKIDKVCSASATDGNGVAFSECFPSTVYSSDGSESVSVDSLSDTDSVTGASFAGADLIALRLNNGYSMILAYDPTCNVDKYSNTANPTSCLAYSYDINTNKAPNKEGVANDISGNISLMPDFFPNCISGGTYDGLCYSETIDQNFSLSAYSPTSSLTRLASFTPDGTFSYSTTLDSSSFGCTDDDGGTDGPTWTCPDLWTGAKSYCISMGGHLTSVSEIMGILDDMVINGLDVSTRECFSTTDEPASHLSGRVCTYDSGVQYYPQNKTSRSDMIQKYSTAGVVCIKD